MPRHPAVTSRLPNRGDTIRSGRGAAEPTRGRMRGPKRGQTPQAAAALASPPRSHRPRSGRPHCGRPRSYSVRPNGPARPNRPGRSTPGTCAIPPTRHTAVTGRAHPWPRCRIAVLDRATGQTVAVYAAEPLLIGSCYTCVTEYSRLPDRRGGTVTHNPGLRHCTGQALDLAAANDPDYEWDKEFSLTPSRHSGNIPQLWLTTHA
jgi:hypothetical protein